MQVSIVTFDGFNEIDTFVALNMLNRVPGINARVCSPTASITSLNGVRVDAQQTLEAATDADAVLIGSGKLTRQMAEDDSVMSRIRVDRERQLIGAQCSGGLILNRLGLLPSGRACSDRITRVVLEEAGIEVPRQSFLVEDNVATAGGCLASHYLAAWVVWRLLDRDAATQALSDVVPVGEADEFVVRALAIVEPYICTAALAALS